MSPELRRQRWDQTVSRWLAGETPIPLSSALELPFCDDDPITIGSELRRVTVTARTYWWPAPWTGCPYVYVSEVAVDDALSPLAVGPARVVVIDPWRAFIMGEPVDPTWMGER